MGARLDDRDIAGSHDTTGPTGRPNTECYTIYGDANRMCAQFIIPRTALALDHRAHPSGYL